MGFKPIAIYPETSCRFYFGTPHGRWSECIADLRGGLYDGVLKQVQHDVEENISTTN